NLSEIAKRAPFVIDDYHKRLTQRVNTLISKAELTVNGTDLLKEVAVFAGRKLDFITQEMLREANTIASKANDAQIARHIVEIKGAIDRLKEQVQNVE